MTTTGRDWPGAGQIWAPAATLSPRIKRLRDEFWSFYERAYRNEVQAYTTGQPWDQVYSLWNWSNVPEMYLFFAGAKSYLLAEFTYPILPSHKGGAMWFYSLPEHDGLCRPAEAIYKDYLGAVKFGNIFSLDAGPDYAGKLRAIDVETLQKVGQMISQNAAQGGAAAAAGGGKA
jgi:hypothetical protein